MKWLYFPCKPWTYTQRFGENPEAYNKPPYNVAAHNGIDTRMPNGTPVYAAHKGVVTFCGHDSSAGLGVVIRTAEPIEGQHYKTIYWHLKEGSIVVRPDQMVDIGDKIAESNNTGASSGPHLHFGLKPIAPGENASTWYNTEQKNGYNGAIDPEPHFTGEFAVDVKIFSIKERLVTILQLLITQLLAKK